MSDDKKHTHHHDTNHSVEKPEKTKQEKFAEDLVYTLNHAIVCGATDLLDPLIGAYTDQKYSVSLHHWFEHRFEKWFGIHLEHHHHPKLKPGQPGFWKEYGKTIAEWGVGEAVGDIGAVPITVGMQYVAPGFMRGIQTVSEPVLGPAFRWSANMHARNWGRQNGIALNSDEVKEYADEVYEHEVTHLPHAFVWTGTAAIGNVATQKILFPKKYIPSLVVGKAAGSFATLVTVLGFRTLAPGQAQKLDKWNTENIAEPATRKISRWLGIDEEVVERVLEEEREHLDGHQLIKHRHHDHHHEHDDDHHHDHDHKSHKKPKQHIETPAKSEQLVAAEARQSRQST